jgi:hypothetical protein
MYTLFKPEETYLSAQQNEALGLLREMILSDSKEEQELASDTLASATPESVLALITGTGTEDSIQQQKIEAFCADENTLHGKAWEQILKDQSFTGKTIKAMDGKIVCSTLDQYLGSYLYNQFKQSTNKIKSLRFLTQACDLHFFYALVAKLEYSSAMVKEAVKNEENITDLKTKIFQDIDMLGYSHWSFGYMHGALILINLGNYFSDLYNESSTVNSVEEISANEQYRLLATEFYEKSITCFLSANFLFSQATSQEINTTIAGENKLADVFGFKDLQEAQAYLKSCTKNFVSDAKFGNLLGTVSTDITAKLTQSGVKTRSFASNR